MAAPEDFLEHERSLIDSGGLMQPPPMDVDGYLECIERCRHDFPDLHILAGVELGRPPYRRTVSQGYDRLVGARSCERLAAHAALSRSRE
jgi:hypothetical protein